MFPSAREKKKQVGFCLMRKEKKNATYYRAGGKKSLHASYKVLCSVVPKMEALSLFQSAAPQAIQQLS